MLHAILVCRASSQLGRGALRVRGASFAVRRVLSFTRPRRLSFREAQLPEARPKRMSCVAAEQKAKEIGKGGSGMPGLAFLWRASLGDVPRRARARRKVGPQNTVQNFRIYISRFFAAAVVVSE